MKRSADSLSRKPQISETIYSIQVAQKSHFIVRQCCRECSASGSHQLCIAVQKKEGGKGIQKGLVENTIDFDCGCAALHLACLIQNYHTVKILLVHETDYKTKDVRLY